MPSAKPEASIRRLEQSTLSARPQAGFWPALIGARLWDLLPVLLIADPCPALRSRRRSLHTGLVGPVPFVRNCRARTGRFGYYDGWQQQRHCEKALPNHFLLLVHSLPSQRGPLGLIEALEPMVASSAASTSSVSIVEPLAA